MRLHAREQRKSAILQFHHDALERVLRLFVGNLQQLQNHRLIRTQHRATGNTEQQGVANLAGRAGYRHTNGGLTHGKLLE